MIRPIRTLRARRALSLLEVVISIAILAMSASLLASLIQTATNNAMASRDELQANLLCESKLAEVALQVIPMQAADWTPITDQTFSLKQWHYRIDVAQTAQPDIMSVTVSVGDDFVIQSNRRPTASLTRWFINPQLNMDTPAADSNASTSSTGAL